jgi:hypothetical protein
MKAGATMTPELVLSEVDLPTNNTLATSYRRKHYSRGALLINREQFLYGC